MKADDIRARCGQEFDGEAHFSDNEASEIADEITRLGEKNDRLCAFITAIKIILESKAESDAARIRMVLDGIDLLELSENRTQEGGKNAG